MTRRRHFSVRISGFSPMHALLAMVCACLLDSSRAAPAPSQATGPAPQSAGPAQPLPNPASPAAAARATPKGPALFMKNGDVVVCLEPPVIAFGRVVYRSADGTQRALTADLVDVEKTREHARSLGAGSAGPASSPKTPAGSHAGTAEAGGRRMGPDFTATRSDGSSLRLSDLRGKVVLVDFWATWCQPCIREMPAVSALYKARASKDFEIVGVSLDHERAKFDGYLKSQGITWPQHFDGKGWSNTVAQAWGVNSIPRTFLLDRQGRIAKTGLRGETLMSNVDAILAELPPPPKAPATP